MEYFKPFCYVLMLAIFILGVNSEETASSCDDIDENTAMCCPVNQTSPECPDNYQLVSKSVTCSSDSNISTTSSTLLSTLMTSTVSLETSTSVTSDSETSTPSSEVANDNSSVVCEKCQINEHFNNDTRECEKCDSSCLKCDSQDCTVCYIEHNGTCFSKCPAGTSLSNRKSENGSLLCDKIKEESDGELPVGIIAGATGCGVVLIVVVIVIIFCCRRHGRCHGNENGGTSKGNQRTAMSLIIETNRNTESTVDKEDKKSKPGRKNYENMTTVLPGQNEIINQADRVTRYTTDPTSEPGRKGKNNVPVPETDTDPYANSAMVKLARNTDLTSVDSRKLEVMVERQELNELGQAPTAPGLLVPTAATKSKKPNLVKRLSQRVSKLKRGKSKDKQPDEYVDMSPIKTEDALVDYENFEFLGDKKDEKVGSQSKNEDQTGTEAGMEIYENYTKNQSGSKTNVAMDDLEDYENTKDIFNLKPMMAEKTDNAAGGPDNELEDLSNLEPYENMAFDIKKGGKSKK
ncbi:hypothetical protein ACF0H5_023241 [Mactra antiquata]